MGYLYIYIFFFSQRRKLRVKKEKHPTLWAHSFIPSFLHSFTDSANANRAPAAGRLVLGTADRVTNNTDAALPTHRSQGSKPCFPSQSQSPAGGICPAPSCAPVSAVGCPQLQSPQTYPRRKNSIVAMHMHLPDKTQTQIYAESPSHLETEPTKGCPGPGFFESLGDFHSHLHPRHWPGADAVQH